MFGLGPDILSNVLYEAPLLAPLLFVDVALLAMIAVLGSAKYQHVFIKKIDNSIGF